MDEPLTARHERAAGANQLMQARRQSSAPLVLLLFFFPTLPVCLIAALCFDSPLIITDSCSIIHNL